MTNALRKLGHAARNRYAHAGAGLTALVVAGSASASDTSAAESAIAAIETEASTMISAAWPVVTTIVAGLVGIKLFKKFANRAS
ncbi:major coat protein [Halomonas sp. PBN3]|uniref:major coat protein n=1 Tax=Halomonas sp. PBN3 TaxID=1397528 RepID=UPI0009DD3568|nr:major coat protein [Halomonas sp. PBN3]